MTRVEMAQAFIVGAKRSPFVKARPEKDEGFFGVHPIDYAAYVAKKTFEEATKGSSLTKDKINDVILGLATKVGKQGFNPARLIAIKAFGENTPGYTVDRLCGSSLEALNIAVRTIKAKDADVIVVMGLEDMKEVPIGCDLMPPPISVGNMWKALKEKDKAIYDSLPDWFDFTNMPDSGKLVAEKYGLTRRDLDEYSAKSQNKGYYAQVNGYFKSEIIPIQTPKGVMSEDNGIRPSNVETLSKLPTVSKENTMITAANASQKTAGTSCLIVVSEDFVNKYKLKPLVEVIATAIVAGDPRIQLEGPVFAIPAVLKKAGLEIKDIDRFEINEAFASVPLACIKELGLDEEKVNVQGGAIGLGHPLGASGGRLAVTLVHQLLREKLNLGLATLCIGAGQSNATILKRCS